MILLKKMKENRILTIIIFFMFTIQISKVLISSNQMPLRNDVFIAEKFDIQIPRTSDVFYENTTGEATDVFVNGDYVYLVDWNSGLAIIDISDPTNPDTLVYENTDGVAKGVYIDGDYAYVADGSEGLAIIDISNPTNPGIPIYENTTGDATDVYVNGDFAYVADGSEGLAIINISDPINPGIPVYENTTGDALGV